MENTPHVFQGPAPRIKVPTYLCSKQLMIVSRNQGQEIPQSKLKLLTVETNDVLWRCGSGTEATEYFQSIFNRFFSLDPCYWHMNRIGFSHIFSAAKFFLTGFSLPHGMKIRWGTCFRIKVAVRIKDLEGKRGCVCLVEKVEERALAGKKKSEPIWFVISRTKAQSQFIFRHLQRKQWTEINDAR